MTPRAKGRRSSDWTITSTRGPGRWYVPRRTRTLSNSPPLGTSMTPWHTPSPGGRAATGPPGATPIVNARCSPPISAVAASATRPRATTTTNALRTESCQGRRQGEQLREHEPGQHDAERRPAQLLRERDRRGSDRDADDRAER